jgi:RimJ/RimL family protein N-acetyltransferase
MSDIEFLTTERLALRPLTVADAPALYAAINDFDVLKMTASWVWPIDLAYVEDRLRVWNKGKNGIGLGIFVDGTLIGNMGGGFEKTDKGAGKALTIGYMIGKPWWGRGYVAEAVKTLCPLLWSRLGAYDIYAEHFFDNPASGRVLEKCGFQHVGAAPLQWCEARQKKIPGEQFMLKAESAL